MGENDERIHEARFISLLLGLQNSAWVALGKVANPVSGKIEKDLQAARGTIDLLETLKVKTRGNLTEQEEKVLAGGLSTLQLNFVEESEKGEETAKGGDKGEGKEKEAPAAGDESAPPAGDAGKGKRPRGESSPAAEGAKEEREEK